MLQATQLEGHGLGALIDRSGGTVSSLGVPKVSVVTLAVQNYDPTVCPP